MIFLFVSAYIKNLLSKVLQDWHKYLKSNTLSLAKTKQTRVAQEKINLIKDILPSSLKPNGVNPLGVLHSELSEGLHAKSDESCLENANHIKSILTFLINQIIVSRQAAKEFTDSMKSLLNKGKG